MLALKLSVTTTIVDKDRDMHTGSRLEPRNNQILRVQSLVSYSKVVFILRGQRQQPGVLIELCKES